MIPVNFSNINSFLHYGWLPRAEAAPPIPIEWLPTQTETAIPKYTDVANSLIESTSALIPKNEHVVVPLSGGLDSRAVLMSALESTSNITAVTVGTPGTFDYDIPIKIAKSLGIQHEAIDLTQIEFDRETISNVAKQTGDWTNILEVYCNLLIPLRYPDTPILTGLLGDFLAGAYARQDSLDWDQAKVAFAARGAGGTTGSLTHQDYDPISALPINKKIPILNAYEELVFLVRHTCSFRPTLFENDFNCKLPFKNQQLIRSLLSLPPEQRYDQKYYINMLLDTWPTSFGYPCKNNIGLPLRVNKIRKLSRRVNLAARRRLSTPPRYHLYKLVFGTNFIEPNINYFDLRTVLQNSNMTNFLISNLDQLKHVDINQEVNKILTNNLFSQQLSANQFNSILRLVSLSLNIRSTYDK